MALTRLRCCVTHCRRTRLNENPEYGEWICGDHWRLVDHDRRRVWGRINRRLRRFGPRRDASMAAARLWMAVKRQAIERALGIRA